MVRWKEATDLGNRTPSPGNALGQPSGPGMPSILAVGGSWLETDVFPERLELTASQAPRDTPPPRIFLFQKQSSLYGVGPWSLWQLLICLMEFPAQTHPHLPQTRTHTRTHTLFLAKLRGSSAQSSAPPCEHSLFVRVSYCSGSNSRCFRSWSFHSSVTVFRSLFLVCIFPSCEHPFYIIGIQKSMPFSHDCVS